MKPLRIAMTADAEIPVPPEHYGGIERMIDLLIAGLLERGHYVTLFANRGSRVKCDLSPYAGKTSGSVLDVLRNTSQIARRVIGGDFDVIHSFGRLAYLTPVLPTSIPKLMTYQRRITLRSVNVGARLAHGTLRFTAVSNSMLPAGACAPLWQVVHNAVSEDRYAFQAHVVRRAPLAFLGRIELIKGTHLAIEVARRAGRDLIIAGNIPRDPVHEEYFNTRIKPHIDGRLVQYVGVVDDAQKNALLGSAAALLMPVLWDEPFGIVMAEALACGTPVIGLRRGSVPEVVDDGITGFVCEDVEKMAAAVQRLAEIDRAACRAAVEKRFCGSAMTDSYLRVYRQLVKQHAAAA